MLGQARRAHLIMGLALHPSIVKRPHRVRPCAKRCSTSPSTAPTSGSPPAGRSPTTSWRDRPIRADTVRSPENDCRRRQTSVLDAIGLTHCEIFESDNNPAGFQQFELFICAACRRRSKHIARHTTAYEGAASASAAPPCANSLCTAMRVRSGGLSTRRGGGQEGGEHQGEKGPHVRAHSSRGGEPSAACAEIMGLHCERRAAPS